MLQTIIHTTSSLFKPNNDKMTDVVEHRGGDDHTSPQFMKESFGGRVPTPPQSADEVDDAGTMDYRFEENRLRSYENWTSPYVHPEDLAAAGFYYTGQIDRVRCFECRTEICRWEEGDDPMSEHQRWGGRCAFIRKMPCGNVPIGVDPSTIPVPRQRSRDVCGPYNLEYRMGAEADTHASSSVMKHRQAEEEQKPQQKLPTVAMLGCLGIAIPKRPDFPDYASYEARLQTFHDWPLSMAQTKEQMADAGFFYTGTGDQTTCYHCGGGLKNWETQDDPWVQHAKWFSTCFYVRLVKGQEFINNVTGKFVPLPSEEEMAMMKFPSCIQKVRSPAPQTSELVDEATPRENAAGPSNTESLTTMPSMITEGQKETSPVICINEKAEAPEEESEDKVIDDARLCKICYNGELGVVFVPCGHIVTCVKCAPGMTTCAVCRTKVELTVRAFFS